MRKEEKTDDMQRMCKCFEVSCIGCPLNCGDSCNIENIDYADAVQLTKDWYDGKYWSSCYKELLV